MVKRALLLLALCGCEVEGTVLVLRDAAVPTMDAESPRAEAGMDAYVSLDARLDANLDANVDAAPEAATPVGVCRVRGSGDGFYDSFPDPALDARWLIAEGRHAFAGRTGTFHAENVEIEGSRLVLRVYGDRHPGGRSAAAIATRDLFASGTYQLEGRLVGPAGVSVALWWQRDDEAEGTITIAAPGSDGAYTHVYAASHDRSGVSENDVTLGATLDDARDHILRFDLYNTSSRSIRFWVDDMPRWDSTSHLPVPRAGRLWIVAGVPDGTAADFDSAELRIANAFITPFGNAGDQCRDGELLGTGLRF